MGKLAEFANKMFYRIAGYTLAIIIGTGMGVYLAVRFLLSPTTRFWSPQTLDAPSACLSDPALGDHGYVQTKSVRLHYVEKGDRSNPLMLCIHGFPEFWFSWRHVLKEFSSDYWVVAIDMRGYGESDKPTQMEQYKLSYLVEDVKGVIKAFGREKCTLVAHDWGGVVAWNFLLVEPQLVDSYIIMNSAHPIAFRKVLSSISIDQLMRSWYAFFFQVPILPEICCQLDDMGLIESGLVNNSSHPVSDEEIAAYKYTFKEPGAFRWPINYYRANFLLEEPMEELKGLGRKSDFPPGLVLYGEKDIYLNKEIQELSAKMVANATLVCIKDANHFIPQDNPKAVIKEMTSFLSRISPKKHRHS